eukprot:3937320-Rhodomonas_salina.1
MIPFALSPSERVCCVDSFIQNHLLAPQPNHASIESGESQSSADSSSDELPPRPRSGVSRTLGSSLGDAATRSCCPL